MASKPEPKLGVADAMGIEFLGPNASESTKDANQYIAPTPIEDVVKPDDEFKPLRRMTATEIKNEKIDYIYKFKKLGEQGVRTTMNYNMNMRSG